MTLARLVRVRGNRGELSAEPLTRPERFRELRTVYLFREPGGTAQQFDIEAAWEHGERVILKFRGVDSISEAETLVGSEVRIPFAERAELPAGEYYQSDLVGCEVIERGSGARLGRVRGWQEYGGPPLLEVEASGGEEILIPFVRSICVEIDPRARRIVVDLPEGLKELGRPEGKAS